MRDELRNVPRDCWDQAVDGNFLQIKKLPGDGVDNCDTFTTFHETDNAVNRTQFSSNRAMNLDGVHHMIDAASQRAALCKINEHFSA